MKTLFYLSLAILVFSPGYLTAQSDAEKIEVALKSSDSKKLEELFKGGVSPDTKGPTGDPYMVTAAIWPDLLKTFIDAGGNVNEGGKTDYTPLFMAVSMSSPQSTKLLIDAGANVNYKQKSTGLTALHFATWKSNCVECVKNVLQAGADVNAQDKNKETAATLMVTAMSPQERANTVKYTTDAMKSYGYNNMPDRFTNPKPEDWDEPADIMALLLDYDLNPDLKNKFGVNVLMNAAYFNKVEIMDKLVKKGADLKAKDKQKKTVWVYAVDGGAGDAMVYLIKNKIAKADETFTWFNTQQGINMRNMTALSVAAINGNSASIKSLLDLGANCTAASSGNFFSNGCLGIVADKTPLVYAIESGKLENVKTIVESCDKKKIWSAWSKFEIRATTAAKMTDCYGGKNFLRPWDYSDAIGAADISAYLKEEYKTYTLGK